MPYVDGPAGRLWVQIVGDGEPVTVFAHGITSSVDELEPLAARTAGTRILFDLRGHGLSDGPADCSYGPDGVHDDLEAVARRFGARRAFGISIGAGAILTALERDPARFDRVALFIPHAVDAVPPADGVLEMADLLERHPLEQVAQHLLTSAGLAPLLRARPYWAELVERRTVRMNAHGVPRALRAFAAGEPPVADPERLRLVSAPALVLAHEGDPLHPAWVARRLAEILPHSELHVWPETLAMYDDVDAFAGTIGRFLSA